MKKVIQTTFIAWLLMAYSFVTLAENENPIELDTKINNVTVYLKSATIERMASVNLKKGKNSIHFKKLSDKININTLQFNAKGIKVLSIDYAQDNYPISENETYKSLMAKRKIISKKINDRKLSIEILNKDLEILEANKTIRYESLNTTELKNTLSFFHDKRVAIEKDKKRFKTETTDLNLELKEVNEKIDDIYDEHKTYYKEVIVTVETSQEKSINCQLKYLVNGVQWYPTYDIMAKDLNSPIEVVFKANIYQNTGIDWKNVNLSIASGNPIKENVLPTLYPNYLNLTQKKEQYIQEKATTYQRMAVAASPTVEEDSWGDFDEETEIEEIGYEYNGYDLESTDLQTQFTYNIPSKYSIVSGAQAKEIALKSEKINTSYTYRVVPKINCSVFLVGSISNWSEYNFISGNANIYFEDQYVGKSIIQSSNASDTLDISLGVDESIIVKRNRDFKMEKKKSLSSKKRENRAWKIELKNNKKVAIHIEVIDQIPISVNEEIIVTPIELSKGAFDSNNGQIKWKLDLPSSISKSILLKYEVEYPTKGYDRLIID